MSKKNKIIIISITVAVAILSWYGFKYYKKSTYNKKITQDVFCDDGASGEINSWQDYTGNKRKYVIKFPKDDDYGLKPSEASINIPESIGKAYGGQDTLVLFAYSKEGLIGTTYSVTHHFFSKQPTISEIEKYFGANKICSESEQTYEGNPMIDFFSVSEMDGKKYYSRYRIILRGNELYELKMNSDTSHFRGYQEFANSFHFIK